METAGLLQRSASPPRSGAGRWPLLGVCLALVLSAAAVARAAAEGPFSASPFGPAVAEAARTSPAGDPSRGNQLALLGHGYEALLLRVHLIRQARHSIDVQTFIWTNDECGRLLIYELIEAARRGVRVRVIADHMFSDQDADTVAFLATVHPNFQLKHYRPAVRRMKSSLWHTVWAGLRSFRDVNQRMHNKLMVFDGAILLTGGRNVENTYFDHATGLNFRDRDVVAVGPVARAAAESFAQYWSYRYAVPSRELRDVDAAIRRNRYRRYATRADYDFGGHFRELDIEASDPGVIAARFASRLRPVGKVTFVADVPGKSPDASAATARITDTLAQAVAGANRSIVIQTPYLVLSPAARRLFWQIRSRSPALPVRISTNSFASTDNLLAYSGNYRLRNQYIEGLRLQVHEFKPRPASLDTLFPRHALMAARARAGSGSNARAPFLCVHSKSLVVDDRIAFVGSYNLDPRSENLNTEAGLLVEDEAFARALRVEIEHDMRPENSWTIARRPLPLRLDAVNALIDGLLSLGPIDVWPIQNTSSFELRAGATPVPVDHPEFHERFRDAGSFPGAEGPLTTREILTRLYKAVGPPLTPIL